MKKKKKLAKNNRYIIIVRASAAPSYFYTLPVEDIVSLIIGRWLFMIIQMINYSKKKTTQPKEDIPPPWPCPVFEFPHYLTTMTMLSPQYIYDIVYVRTLTQSENKSHANEREPAVH